jgi:hypothetical protein
MQPFEYYLNNPHELIAQAESITPMDIVYHSHRVFVKDPQVTDLESVDHLFASMGLLQLYYVIEDYEQCKIMHDLQNT